MAATGLWMMMIAVILIMLGTVWWWTTRPVGRGEGAEPKKNNIKESTDKVEQATTTQDKRKAKAEAKPTQNIYTTDRREEDGADMGPEDSGSPGTVEAPTGHVEPPATPAATDSRKHRGESQHTSSSGKGDAGSAPAVKKVRKKRRKRQRREDKCPEDSGRPGTVEAHVEPPVAAAATNSRKHRESQHTSSSGKGDAGSAPELKDQGGGEEPTANLVADTSTNISKIWHSDFIKLKERIKKGSHDPTVKDFGTFKYVDHEDFRIGHGTNGTEVFLALLEDDTEVAVKKMGKFFYHLLVEEANLLRPRARSFIRYHIRTKDENFAYIVLELCEYNLEEYLTTNKNLPIKKRIQLVKELLEALESQHSIRPHRNLNPKSILIGIDGHLRLANYGRTETLPEKQTTLNTIYDVKGDWRAKETLMNDDISYADFIKLHTFQSDVQVTGMLIYYILSGGYHPFGEGNGCLGNIYDESYNLNRVDVLPKHLIKQMINGKEERPTLEECLAHALFWLEHRQREYLRQCGNHPKVKGCRERKNKKLAEERKEWRQYKKWKHIEGEQVFTDGAMASLAPTTIRPWIPQKFLKELDSYSTPYPENLFGLLLFNRNLHEHYDKEVAKYDVMKKFPDLFGHVYKFAEEQGWNTEEPGLKALISS